MNENNNLLTHIIVTVRDCTFNIFFLGMLTFQDLFAFKMKY